ncbi:MAG: hypothetical protein CM1200mP26_24150 [Acidimicrobiales bacterium]|nr:MAG: hypothetical protein CM1200mP26_24150 [Acidimicrobiales bacterium]
MDIGAAEYIHRRLIEERSAGNAILVISEDLDEVLALSDRVAVMFEGQIVAVMDVAEAMWRGSAYSWPAVRSWLRCPSRSVDG